MTKARDTANIVGGGFSGTIAGATMEPTGDTAAGDNAAIGFTAAEGLILTGQGSTSDITLKNDADATVFTVPTGTDDILFPDSAKILMGAGSDLQIYHDGSNSFISDQGTGQLTLLGSNAIALNNAANTENMLVAFENGSVDLYYNNSKKLATTNTGIDVTGAITVNGAALGGGGMEFISSSGAISDGTASVAFTGFDASKYDSYKFFFLNVVSASDNRYLCSRVSVDGGNSYDSNANYRTTQNYDLMYVSPAIGAASGETTGVSGEMTAFNPAYTGGYRLFLSTVSIEQYDATMNHQVDAVGYRGNEGTAVNAIQFLMSSGNIKSGEITMFGIVNS